MNYQNSRDVGGVYFLFGRLYVFVTPPDQTKIEIYWKFGKHFSLDHI